jgi:holin-like protein
MGAIRGFAWLLLLQTLGELMARGAGLPFPGPVVGMVLLMVGLRWSALRQDVAEVAQFLLAHLSLLFVPVGVGVMTHLDLLEDAGLRLLIVLVVATWAGLIVSALTLRWLWRHAPQDMEPRP